MIIDGIEYQLSPQVVKTRKQSGELALYNWANGELAVFHEEGHPIRVAIATGAWHQTLEPSHAEDVDWLKSVGILSEVDPRQRDQAETQLPPIAQEKLHLILLPAGEACNLDCVYCYEDHSDSRRMGAEHLNAVKNLCISHRSESVFIEYFGGEPLLNIQFIEDLASSLREEAIAFSSAITTNGSLITKTTLDRLHRSGVRSYQITLDGPESVHNVLRRSKSKALNSFCAVTSGLQAIASSPYSDISVTVRINANSRTVKQEVLDEFMRIIRSIISPEDSRFTFFPKMISDYAKSNLRELVGMESIYCKGVSATDVVHVLENRLMAEGYALADGVFLARRNGYRCYANSKKSYVISPDLSVKKCTVALNDPINLVGRLAPDGTFLPNQNLAGWIADYSTAECRGCFAFSTCGGNSCPLVNRAPRITRDFR